MVRVLICPVEEAAGQQLSDFIGLKAHPRNLLHI